MPNVSLLEELTYLARQPSEECRRQLLRNLTELFSSGTPEARAQTGGMFEDVVSRVIDDVAVELRCEVSEKLSRTGQSPRKLMVRLANDEISVASPVLRNSDALTDQDLVEVARERSQDYLLAISDRRQLSETVTDALVEKGGREVLHSVTRNDGARFSEEALGTLAGRARDDRQLQDNLVGRKDLTMPAANELRPYLTERLRQKLDEADLRAASAGMDQAVETTVRRVQSEMRGAQKARFEVKVMIADIQKGKLDLDRTVDMLCKSDRAVDLAKLISALCDLRDIDVTKVLFKAEAGAIAVLCKEIGVSEAAYASIAELRQKRLRTEASQTRREIRLYGMLDEADAHRAVRFVKLRRAAF